MRGMRRTIAAVVLWFLACSAQAQQFDAVSIRPNNSGEQSRSFRVQPGQIMATNVTLRHIIWNAYNITDFLVVGGPDWAATERFDLTAKSSSPTITPNEMRAMLRSALADRFKLQARMVTQERPIYTLVRARPGGAPGPRLVSTPGPCDPSDPRRVCGFSFSGSRLASPAVTMQRLAQELRGIVERPVVDATALEGLYQITLEWSPDQQGDGPSLFTALQEQLGLRLEPGRGPVEVLLIDSAERPMEN
jgi:bla regulator protein BlaR1